MWPAYRQLIGGPGRLRTSPALAAGHPRRPSSLSGVVTLVAALTLWVVATCFMGLMTFGTAWDIGHTRPLPDGLFPEGWSIYGYLGAYTLFGATLVWALDVIPSD